MSKVWIRDGKIEGIERILVHREGQESGILKLSPYCSRNMKIHLLTSREQLDFGALVTNTKLQLLLIKLLADLVMNQGFLC